MNDLEEFFERKIEKHRETAGAVDWSARKEKWLAALSRLYESIETWLRPSVRRGLVEVRFVPKVVNEENIGRYTLEQMKLRVGGEQVVLDPKGTIVIGARGRVDMIGDEGSVMLMLFEWEEWEFAVRTPALKRWPFTEESFSDALKEVMRQ